MHSTAQIFRPSFTVDLHLTGVIGLRASDVSAESDPSCNSPGIYYNARNKFTLLSLLTIELILNVKRATDSIASGNSNRQKQQMSSSRRSSSKLVQLDPHRHVLTGPMNGHPAGHVKIFI
ncbi:hypothetical protein PGT21_006825 [Puccinia graminis f. sp. tritici]|uniref:Uncharacterized protein n=1 Tax=Puccinia graminis f. sp. tritici TaxID=56615 RepID=A0A5B0PX02_PUCGR|nr:hypothetical protein PGTUg99_027638 [Puccinia graminis f. sp. tritici]KAA1105420.1 hypothetical protein PGT21_006825 [Puccinia graminis f. sp. tritici]